MSDYLKTAQAIIVCEHDDGDDDRNVTVSWRTDDGGTAGWTFDAEVGPGETSRAVDEIHRRIAEAIENAVAAALAAERAKFAAFAGPDGEPRKVLGTLPVTADGCFIGMGATVYGGPYGKNGGRISDEALLDADSEREAETAILPDGRGLEVGISPFSLWPKGSPRKPRLYSSYAALDAAKEQP